jgi:alkylation response protein AidB-like acyl-CoA dehydrogenase
MALVDLELDLSPEEQAVRDTVHKFAAEVMRPAGEALDKLADPADVIAKDSVLWDVFKQYRALGLGEFGGGAGGEELTLMQRARLGCITGEELGWGDTGLGVSLGVAGFPGLLANMSGNPALIERFGGDDVIGCWAVTEPDHGSDMVDFAARVGTGDYGRPNCIARKDGDSFVISGQKAAWVSNGTIATAAALFCGVDMGSGPEGCGVFIAPLDEGGVTPGKPLDKIGQRPLNQGELFFDELRVPAEYMVVPPEGYQFAIEMVLTMANGGMGTSFVGLARAALELAIDYAKERIQGGAPIIEHQSVKARLFEMFRKVEAARALNRKVVLYNTVNAPGQLCRSSAGTACPASTRSRRSCATRGPR